ncbi:hypothetical protein evm_015151 [Chilo suppressalis]|nr:hypothetical protein evm_015151 [Chilo suppressalis]
MLEWTAVRRPACADLQTMALHTRRAPRPGPPATHLRPPAGFYPHALLPGQYQHSYRRYTADHLRCGYVVMLEWTAVLPLNTVTAVPPTPPQPESSSDSDADSDHSQSSDDSDRLPAKRKRLSKVKRNSQTDGAKEKDRGEREKEERGEPEETCRVCKLRLEANRSIRTSDSWPAQPVMLNMFKSKEKFYYKKIHADQAAAGTRTRTFRNPGECTDQLCYHGPDGRVDILLARHCLAA